MNCTANSRLRLVSTLILAMLTSDTTFAQSEASISSGASAVSEGSAEVVGAIIGTGAGLSIGTVVITSSGASVLLESSADAASGAFSVAITLPLEIARKLHDRHGEQLEIENSTGGILLRSRGELIAFLPSASSQNQARREL